MKGTYLGEFEEVVLLAVGILGEDAYGVAIRKEIEKQTKRSINIGAVHTALHRLEEKGCLKSEFGEATLVRGGKRKRNFTITAYGLKTLKKALDLRNNMWSQCSNVVIQKS
ncbi:MAG: helix-turn-helix transcriptional regulator [Chryseolinea sp.]